jgi:hypothetical protein
MPRSRVIKGIMTTPPPSPTRPPKIPAIKPIKKLIIHILPTGYDKN